MDAKRINEIKERCEAATPGPWTHDEYGNQVWQSSDPDTGMMIAQIRGWGHLTGKGIGALGLSEDEAIAILTANTEFIAHAREDIPALLAENATKDAEITRLTAKVEAMEKAFKEDARLCEVCISAYNGQGEYTCENVCRHGENWQFDEARFATEKEANCEGNI